MATLDRKKEERQDEILHTQFPLVALTGIAAFGADGIYSGVRGAAPSSKAGGRPLPRPLDYS